MRLHEEGRQLLLELMNGRDDSLRKLASVAGYSSHSYIGRLLDPNDPARTVTTDAGSLIAAYYGVKPERFFVTETTFSQGRDDPKRKSSGSRSVQKKQTDRRAA